MSSSRTSIRATALPSAWNSASLSARSDRATKPSAATLPRASRRNCWWPPRGWAMYARSGPSAVTGPVWGGSGGLEDQPGLGASAPSWGQGPASLRDHVAYHAPPPRRLAAEQAAPHVQQGPRILQRQTLAPLRGDMREITLHSSPDGPP